MNTSSKLKTQILHFFKEIEWRKKTYNIDVTLELIKAHNNNISNDKDDKFTKQGCRKKKSKPNYYSNEFIIITC